MQRSHSGARLKWLVTTHPQYHSIFSASNIKHYSPKQWEAKTLEHLVCAWIRISMTVLAVNVLCVIVHLFYSQCSVWLFHQQAVFIYLIKSIQTKSQTHFRFSRSGEIMECCVKFLCLKWRTVHTLLSKRHKSLEAMMPTWPWYLVPLLRPAKIPSPLSKMCSQSTEAARKARL